jgi:hypothetical protein
VDDSGQVILDRIQVHGGPARDGAPLELGVLGLDSDDPVIIHALPLWAKFYRFLR